MNKTKKSLDENRRNFIKKSALVGAGLAASATVTSQAVAAVGEDIPETKKGKGYQLSAHVLEYYKTAAS